MRVLRCDRRPASQLALECTKDKIYTLIYSKYHRRLRVPDNEAQEPVPDRKVGRNDTHQRRNEATHPKSNYELFNCNNLNIRYWSWNYRGCWHQTCPPMDTR